MRNYRHNYVNQQFYTSKLIILHHFLKTLSMIHIYIYIYIYIYVRYEIPECLFMFYFLCFLDDCCNVHNLLLFMLDIV